eukprot:CAMPEP_0170543544 /NCGR_PEP_ID=MMETSP0211-20121228/2631_1 /TAXON_ID=311385 /ORGANISM="Pseudokeronopsis sp., Strain OXSARD2" /LENGTH=84 /DNA_ID=CAMNT_0010846953 /DNA_START=1017 /DNA_END=1271 /DNA_ORIENTATION=+
MENHGKQSTASKFEESKVLGSLQENSEKEEILIEEESLFDESNIVLEQYYDAIKPIKCMGESNLDSTPSLPVIDSQDFEISVDT